MTFDLRSFHDSVELAKNAAGDWLRSLAERKEPNRAYCVALSGGRIARDFFKAIATQADVSQNQVHFFWADERCVQPTDTESNFGMARELLLGPLKIPEAQIHRLRGEEPEATALQDAREEICRVAPVVNGQPVLDMIFLGMGEDGHVASLFPGEPEELAHSPAIYRAVTAAKPPPRRLTLGYGAIAAAREVWVLASGAGKAGALKESLSPGGKTPLARVLRDRENTRIYADFEPG